MKILAEIMLNVCSGTLEAMLSRKFIYIMHVQCTCIIEQQTVC